MSNDPNVDGFELEVMCGQTGRVEYETAARLGQQLANIESLVAQGIKSTWSGPSLAELAIRQLRADLVTVETDGCAYTGTVEAYSNGWFTTWTCPACGFEHVEKES